MNLNNFTFARPIAKLSDALIKDLEENGPDGLCDHHDALLTMAAGVAPGRPEAFASAAARDAALGDYGPYTQFVPTTWDEARAGGFGLRDVAIGHRFGDPAFDLIAPQILDAVAEEMADTDGPGEVVVARMNYTIRSTRRGIMVIGAPEFGVATDFENTRVTAGFLQAEFARRLRFSATS